MTRRCTARSTFKSYSFNDVLDAMTSSKGNTLRCWIQYSILIAGNAVNVVSSLAPPIVPKQTANSSAKDVVRRKFQEVLLPNLLVALLFALLLHLPLLLRQNQRLGLI
jgi:hypothetical protein